MIVNRMRGRLRAKHGSEGCSGADGATFATAAELCWVCWWNAKRDWLASALSPESDLEGQ